MAASIIHANAAELIWSMRKSIERELMFMNDNSAMERLNGPLSPDQESTKDRLQNLKKHLMDRVADIDQALTLLEKYPDIELLTDLLRRI